MNSHSGGGGTCSVRSVRSCEDELSTPASPPADVIHRMDSELEEVFGDVGSLPTMVSPVCDIDGAPRVSPAEGPVIAPPAVSAFVIRPSMATSPTEPVRGLAPVGDFDRGASGSEAGGVGHRKTVTAAGEKATESATRSCEPSSTWNSC